MKQEIITRQSVKQQETGIYRIGRPALAPDHGPQTPCPLVIDSPHSGRVYPDDFLFACDPGLLRLCEDSFVDEILEGSLSARQVPFLQALFPRTYIDPNRAEDDILPECLSTPWPVGDLHPTFRAQAGHGLIRQTIGPEKVPVYDGLLSAEEVIGRISRYYRPYHAALRDMIDQSFYRAGCVYHLSFHSMPDAPLVPYFPGRIPDFVLGDLDGRSCGPGFRRLIQSFLQDLGYQVAVNVPYKGAEIVRRYGQPATGRHSLQIEIRKGLYLDQSGNKNESKIKKLKGDIDKMVEFVLAELSPLSESLG